MHVHPQEVGHVGERGATPKSERLAGYRLGACGALDQALEAPGVDRIRVHTQLVAATVGDDLGVAAREQAPQLRHIELNHLRRRRRRVVAPQPVHQAVDGDRGVRVEGEDGQQGSLLRCAKRDRPSVEGRRDWPEQLHVQAVGGSGSRETDPTPPSIE